MFDFLRRTQLVKRGLASGKKRRRRPSNEILRNLEHAPWMKVVIFAAFIAGLSSLIFSGQQPEPTKNFVIALLFFVTSVAQLWINQPNTFRRNSRVFLVYGIIFFQLAITKLLLVLCNSGLFVLLKPETAWLIAPYAFAPLVLCVLLGRNHGLYGAVFVSLFGSILVNKMDAPMLVNGLISGFTAVYLTLQVRRRSRLIRAGLLRRSRHLAVVSHFRLNRTDQPVQPRRDRLDDDRVTERARDRQRHRHRHGGRRRASDPGASLRDHYRHFVVGSVGFESSAPAPHDDRSSGHISS